MTNKQRVAIESLRNGAVVRRDEPARLTRAQIYAILQARAETILWCRDACLSLHPQVAGELWMVLIRLGDGDSVGLVDVARSRDSRTPFVHGGDRMPECSQWGVTAERAVVAVQQFLKGRIDAERIGSMSVYRSSGPDTGAGGQARTQRALGFGVVR